MNLKHEKPQEKSVENKSICARLIYGIHQIKTAFKKLHIHHYITY